MKAEDLALAIQAGENVYEDLWLSVRNFVYKQAKSYSRYFPDSIIEVDDLAQGGYLAMCEAVKTYNPAVAAFLTHLRLYLTKTWRSMYGLRGKPDPCDNALSLDDPVGEDENVTHLDFLPDERAVQAFEDKEDDIFLGELRSVLDKALASVPHGDVIRQRYFQKMTGREIANEMGVSVSRVHQLESDGLRQIRKGPYVQELRSFNFYGGTSLRSWKEKGSIQERYVLWKEHNERNKSG